MKDIKSLFLAAKKSGREPDITLYREAVQETLSTNPSDYILQLEYIISSDIGLRTLKPFIEQYGLPIACYDSVMTCLEKCINKCKDAGKNDSEYKEAVSYLESFRQKYIKCFAMYEFYENGNTDNYVSTYYGKNDKDIQHRMLVSGMINKFGESAIPDLIITASEMGGKAISTLVEYVGKIESTNPALFYEWVVAAMENPVAELHQETCLADIKKKSASSIVSVMKDRNQRVFRESMIMGDEDAYYEYSEEEIEAIKDLISFKEYYMTWIEEIETKTFAEGTEVDESVSKLLVEAQNEIYSLYEELDGLVTEEEDKVIKDPKDEELVPMFGIVKSYSESPYRSDGTMKSKEELMSIRFKHQIKTLTRGDNYSHAVVSFDENLEKMYSYDDEGFVEDGIMTNDSWLSTDSIYICVMFVTRAERDRMEKFIKNLVDHKGETKYAYANLLKAYIGKPLKSDKRFVCSTFTSYILQCSNPKNLHRDYSRLRPEDITILPRAFYVMNVKDRLEFVKKKEEMHRRVKEIFQDYHEEIEDYNNYLPKIMLKDRMDKLKTFDKILDWFINKL